MSFLLRNIFQPADEVRKIDGTETEVLAAGSDGVGNLDGLGGAEHKDHPLGRLFESFQERVESFLRDLVRFIDDEDFVPIARRAVANIVPDLAHLINAAIRSSVDLDDVTELPGGDLDAAGAHAAGCRGRAIDAVQTTRQNPRNGRLAGSPLAGKNIAVRDPVALDRILERFLDVLLADKFGECLRTVLPGDDLIHGVRTASGICDGAEYARPRVIRGTRAKPLPLLPSGPGGVYSRPLHEARSLTIHNPIIHITCGVAERLSAFLRTAW